MEHPRHPDSSLKSRRQAALAARPARSARPARMIATVATKAAQVVLSVIIVILHPPLRWLRRLLARSALVRRYIAPAFAAFIDGYYEPFFHRLGGLPPFLATLSIALPLAVLEPAKLYATILIAEHPKAGILLWLVLQGLSLVLIDRTWKAVRPQSRKIWIVSRLHAWGWLNAVYVKSWVTRSAIYRAMARRIAQARMRAVVLWRRLTVRLRRPRG